MFLQTTLYLLVFRTMISFGYQELSDYADFTRESKGGLVYKWAPDGEYDLVVDFAPGDNVHRDFKFDLFFKLGQLGEVKEEEGDGFLDCEEFHKIINDKTKGQAYKLAVRLSKHSDLVGIKLDHFEVTECNKEEMKDMFKVTDKGGLKYSLTFKATDKNCYVRIIEIEEFELNVFVERKAPQLVDCSTLDDSFKTKEGRVVPDSWMDTKKLLHTHELQYYVDTSSNAMKKLEKMECREFIELEQPYHVLTLFFQEFPLDRIPVKSCNEWCLKTSVEFVNRVKGGDSADVIFRFHDYDNNCHTRKYEVRIKKDETRTYVWETHLHRYRLEHEKTCPDVKKPLDKFVVAIYKAACKLTMNSSKEDKKNSKNKGAKGISAKVVTEVNSGKA